MNYLSAGFVWLLLLLSLGISVARPQTPDAEAELKLGMAAYEKGTYEEAITHLELATSLQPNDTNGHYYLALANSGMCTVHTWCEKRWSEAAIREFDRVLESDPAHKEGMKSLAYLFYRLARLKEAQAYYRKAAAVDPDDTEAIFGIAFLDFTTSWQFLMEHEVQLGLRPGQSMIRLPMCDQIRQASLPKVAEGIDLLGTAELRDDADAQAYLAVLYQERAELQCGDANAYKYDQSLARESWDRVCNMRRTQERRPGTPPYRLIPAPPPPEYEKDCTSTA